MAQLQHNSSEVRQFRSAGIVLLDAEVSAYKTLQISESHTGAADLQMTADSPTWLRFLRQRSQSLVGAV
jgi:hypothetical protein